MKPASAPNRGIRKWVATLVGGPASLVVGLVGQPASAQGIERELGGEAGAAFDQTGSPDTGERLWAVRRRAPRELLAKSQIERVLHQLVQPDSSVLGTSTPDVRADPGNGHHQSGFLTNQEPITVAGIRLGTGTSSALQGRRYLPDTRCESSSKCMTDKNAISSGYSLGEVSSVGWIVGAVNLGLGAFLLMTHDRKAGAETSIGADVYKGGAGLKFRRSVW